MISLNLKTRVPLKKRINDLLKLCFKDQAIADAVYKDIFSTDTTTYSRVVNMSWCFNVYVHPRFTPIMSAISTLDKYYYNANELHVAIAQLLLQTQNEMKTRLLSSIQKNTDDSVLWVLTNEVTDLVKN